MNSSFLTKLQSLARRDTSRPISNPGLKVHLQRILVSWVSAAAPVAGSLSGAACALFGPSPVVVVTHILIFIPINSRNSALDLTLPLYLFALKKNDEMHKLHKLDAYKSSHFDHFPSANSSINSHPSNHPKSLSGRNLQNPKK